MRRRAFLRGALAAVCAGGLASRTAWGGSYLDRAALMLDEAKREADLVKPRSGDKELLLVVKALTEARVKVGRKMNVPAAVVDAHPHLMLVLENCDRAMDAVIAADNKKFAECLVAAVDEERTFRNLIKQLGYTLPKV